jgi:hypothetical protein
MSFSVANFARFRFSVPQLLEEVIWTPIQETKTIMSLSNEKTQGPLVVGFHGFPGSGKDTLGQNLRHFYGFKSVAFASPLKQCMSTLFGFPVLLFEMRDKKEELLPGYDDLTPRVIAQRGGDALKTAFGDNFLVDITKNQILQHHTDAHPVVVTDVRFENEAKMIKEFDNGVIIKLDAGDRVTSLGSGASHRSNNPLPDEYIDFTVSTDCTIFESEDQLRKILGLGKRYSY